MQNILVFQDETLASDFLALVYSAAIAERVSKNLKVNLGFATGVTPLLMYQQLITIHQGQFKIKQSDFLKMQDIANKWLKIDFDFLNRSILKESDEILIKPLSWNQVQTFNLDEFVGLPKSHPERFSTYMSNHLFQFLDLKTDLINFPDPDQKNLEMACQEYETKISQNNDSLLQLITLGINGHMAYNEPNTPLDSWTHEAKLSAETRANLVKQKKFKDLASTPMTALTVGVKTILNMQQVLMVSFGAAKAAMTKRMLEEPVNDEITSSALQNHQNCLFVLDQAAAQDLTKQNQKYHIAYF